MSNDRELAAEWWEKHSNSKSGADYARRIREGDSAGLGHGQFASIIRKGEARAKAMGLAARAGGEEAAGARKRRARG